MRKRKTDRKIENKIKPSTKQNIMGLDTIALGVFHDCQIYKLNVTLPKLRCQNGFILMHSKTEDQFTTRTPSSLSMVRKCRGI